MAMMIESSSRRPHSPATYEGCEKVYN
jgi:hypothetical protein